MTTAISDRRPGLLSGDDLPSATLPDLEHFLAGSENHATDDATKSAPPSKPSFDPSRFLDLDILGGDLSGNLESESPPNLPPPDVNLTPAAPTPAKPEREKRPSLPPRPNLHHLEDRPVVDPKKLSVDHQVESAEISSPPQSRKFEAAAHLSSKSSEADFSPPVAGNDGSPAIHSGLIPAFIDLRGQMTAELRSNLTCLTSLNRSRRISLLTHLGRLAGEIPSQKISQDPKASSLALRRWIEGPCTDAQVHALSVFMEEVSLVYLGQALLLKSWSDRQVRNWQERDLRNLNWTLTDFLKSRAPVGREVGTWQMTRPNLYSWFTPSELVTREIFHVLSKWELSGFGPDLLIHLMNNCRKSRADLPEARGYDERFFNALWSSLPRLGFDLKIRPESKAGFFQRTKKNRKIFCPTLRDGRMIRTLDRLSPEQVEWAGFEHYPFHLMVAELSQLWSANHVAPLWCAGSGLEAHPRDQLDLNWSSPQQSTTQKIAELEACELGVVLEERKISTFDQSSEAALLREELEQLPYYNEIRGGGTNLGTLQVCLSISKLRPKGQLFWTREHALDQSDGQKALKFIFDRSCLLYEIDFSGLKHSLPSSVPLFPRFVYLFEREVQSEVRKKHRPVQIKIEGHIRSHIELPLVIEDSLKALSDPNYPARGMWKIHRIQSPSAQHDWVEHGPDQPSVDTLNHLEVLREESIHLGQVTAVRSISPKAEPFNPAGKFFGIHLCLANQDSGQKLTAEALSDQSRQERRGGFLVCCPNAHWVHPLKYFLESSTTHDWLEHYTEKRQSKWKLREQNIKFIPVPKTLVQLLRNSEHSQEHPCAEWIEKLRFNDDARTGVLRQLKQEEREASFHARIFAASAEVLSHVDKNINRLYQVIHPNGDIRWHELVSILPPKECVPFTLHPDVAIAGTMPNHIPIHRVDRIEGNQPIIILACESGFSIQVKCQNPILMEMIIQQAKAMEYPTWSELTQNVLLPRNPHCAQDTAQDIISSIEELRKGRQQYVEILKACRLF